MGDECREYWFSGEAEGPDSIARELLEMRGGSGWRGGECWAAGGNADNWN